MYAGESKQWDWRDEVKEKMKEAGPRGNIKELMDYTQIEENCIEGCQEEYCPNVSPRRKESRN